MQPSVSRVFVDAPAVRERVPLLIGLVGSSNSGKTFSALRLATGIQRVVGGDIGVIDTEARRALHYADNFKFSHLAFEAPFGPLDYLAAVEHFYDKGVRNIVVDSMSHEHEGPGGVLEMHEVEAQRLAKHWNSTPEKVKFSAWQKPKSERRRLLNTLLQMQCNFIFCFRAKEKLKIVRGQDPKPLGWMPIAGEEFVYEMTLNCLLYPSSGGVPSWHPDELGERAIVKLPVQFRDLFEKSEPLSEQTGEALARWAEGGAERPKLRAVPREPGEDDGADPEQDERAALLESVRMTLSTRWPGDGAAAKAAKAAALEQAFKLRSWGAVQQLSLDALIEGRERLRKALSA